MRIHPLLTRTPALVLCLLLAPWLVPSAAGADAAPTQVQPKRDAPSSRLLLPFYLVDPTAPTGRTTIWTLRNESLVDVTVTIDYYEADSPQAPQRTEQIVIGGKEIRVGNLRSVPDLEVDGDGFARGFVLFTTDTEPGMLYGDTFYISPGEDFAEGSLLVDASDGVDSDLCNLFTMRFLQGGAFGGITEMVLWVDSDSLPLAEGAIIYSVYDGEGNLEVTDELFVDSVASRFDVSSLIPGNFVDGAIEIQFAEGLRGYVAVGMSASGRYSVGFEAVCKA